MTDTVQHERNFQFGGLIGSPAVPGVVVFYRSPPLSKKAVSPGSTDLRVRQNTGCG